MMNDILLLCIIAHAVGDYYLQNNAMAFKKNSRFAWLAIHCALYAIPFILALAFIKPSAARLYAFAFTIAGHFAVDTAKFFLIKILPKTARTRALTYIGDQFAHFAVMTAASYIFTAQIAPHGYLGILLADFGIPFLSLVKWTAAILLICKPANVTFTVLFSRLRPGKRVRAAQSSGDFLSESKNPGGLIIQPAEEEGGETGIKNAGGLIGFLERVIIVILLSLGQFAAIGLVLTAKSIARYEKISKEPQFAEYYLIGTLTSMLAAFIVYYAVFGA
ncbi:MAG: DUF3307 domain-containing protein [Clostridia bacterium]|nr:DUF3307 domain-containing protein [Clostridia bacterium]